jgi:AraC-like DNA-binding protein
MKLTMPERVALEGCSIARPAEWAGAIECVEAKPALRSFPTQVTLGLGVCLKRTGNTHDVVADGRMLQYPAGAICIRPPGCVWSVARTDAAFLSMDCHPDLLPAGAAFLPMTFVPRGALPGLVSQIGRLIHSRSALARAEALAALFDSLAGAGIMRAAELREETGAGAAGRARDFLVAHLADDIRLDELARRASANKFVLVRDFRRRFGVTPHAYQVRLRIEKARELIARHVPLAVVASTVGFADQSHLGRHFKRIVGVTPGQYADSPQYSRLTIGDRSSPG